MSEAGRHPERTDGPSPGSGARTVAVIGAGISGLAAARRLLQRAPRGTRVIVLEASPRVGGKLYRTAVAGVWTDVGAEAMLARRPEGVAEARAVGLADQLMHPLTTSALVRSRGTNHGLPARTLIGVPGDVAAVAASGIVSDEAIRRVLAEPDSRPLPELTEDVAVGALVEDRFGSEIVDRLVDPLLGGVYAGRARELSLAAAIPALADRLRSGGSLLRAVQALTAAATPATAASGPGADAGTPQSVFASLAGGLGALPEAMAAGLDVRLSTAVQQIRPVQSGYRLVLGSKADPQLLDVDGVVIATPAAKSARLLADTAPEAVADLAAIDTASMAIVTLAFRAGHDDVALPPGSGVLVPSVEGLRIKAMTFSSQKWPGVGTSEGIVLLRASLGRAGDNAELQRSDEELLAVVRTELATLTGVSASPVDSHVQRWGGALPQYRIGHVDRVQRIVAAVEQHPGIAVCGASYHGVGIPACIASAHIAADRVAAAIRPAAQ